MAEDKSPSGIAEHPVVAKLIADPSSPPNFVVLTGYVGRSPQAESLRLYSTPAFDAFVELRRDAVLHSHAVPDDPAGLGRSALWVKAGTPVLSGSIAPAGAPRPGAAGGASTRRLTLNAETLRNLGVASAPARNTIPSHTCDDGGDGFCTEVCSHLGCH
jgi:hypothetical protein